MKLEEIEAALQKGAEIYAMPSTDSPLYGWRHVGLGIEQSIPHERLEDAVREFNLERRQAIERMVDALL